MPQSKLQTLVIVRHGKYVRLGSSEELTIEGIEETAHIGDLLRKELNLNGTKPVILSSTAPRAQQSAEIIADVFSAPFTTHKELSLDDGDSNPYDLIHAEAKKSSTIILITHEPYSNLNVWFLDHEYGITDIPQSNLKNSHAKLTDCTTGNVTNLQPPQ